MGFLALFLYPKIGVEMSDAASVIKKRLGEDRREISKINEEDLRRARRMVSSLLLKLEDNLLNPSEDEDLKTWWGDKENALSVLTKITQVLLKVIPAEQEILNGNGKEAENVSTDDMEILEQYVRRCAEQGKPS